MVTRTGYWKDKATQPPPIFGEVGTRVIRFTGERPCQHRGKVTQELYVFTDEHPQLHVDLRDLPALAQHIGREQLQAVSGQLPALEQDEELEEEKLEEADDGISDDSPGSDA